MEEDDFNGLDKRPKTKEYKKVIIHPIEWTDPPEEFISQMEKIGLRIKTVAEPEKERGTENEL